MNENPLEINLADRHRHTSVNDSDRLPITQRLEVFDCSCCPPNVTRYLAAVGGSIYSVADGALYVHQFMENTAAFDGMRLQMQTRYPQSGNVRLTVSGAKGRTVFVRIPGWCSDYTCSLPCRVQNGYAAFSADSDTFILGLDFRMQPLFVAAHPAVRADAGKAALMYGPVVYCMEGVDNGENLFDLVIDPHGGAEVQFDETYGANVITLPARRSEASDETALYAPCGTDQATPAKATFIPYYAYANRGESDMTVWFRCR